MPDRSILNHLREGCQIIGPDFRYLFVNDAVCRQARKAREELVGRAMAEVYPGIDHTVMFAALKRCMVERAALEMENEFSYGDGTSAWFALKFEPVPAGVFILSMDITDRKRDQLELENRLQRLQALREIDLAIIGSPNVKHGLQMVADKAASTLKVDAVAMLLHNPYTHLLEPTAQRGFRSRLVEKPVRLGEGTAGRAVLEHTTVELATGSPEPAVRQKLIEEEGFVWGMAVPLIAKGNVLGVMDCFHRQPLEPNAAWLEFLHALAGQASIAVESSRLFQDLQRANSRLVFAYDSTIEGWSRALELRDHETEGHTARVTEMTVALARMAGMHADEVAHVRRGALLHDIGKMAVPDAILRKPGKLTPEEWEIMRRHPTYAYEMLHQIEYLLPALAIPQWHHEKWDGSGYPQGLKGEAIPVAARLFAVVDVWDALRSNRPYRPGWSEEKTMTYLEAQSGRHFDPEAVRLFRALLRESRNADSEAEDKLTA